MVFASLGSVCNPVFGLLVALAAGAAGWVLRGRQAPKDGAATAGEPVVLAPVTAATAEAEEAVVASGSMNELLATAAEQADELICIIRPDGTIAHANAAFCRALGYDLAALRAMRSVDVLAQQSRASISEIESAVRTDGVWRGTLVRQRQDGTTFIS